MVQFSFKHHILYSVLFNISIKISGNKVLSWFTSRKSYSLVFLLWRNSGQQLPKWYPVSSFKVQGENHCFTTSYIGNIFYNLKDVGWHFATLKIIFFKLICVYSKSFFFFALMQNVVCISGIKIVEVIHFSAL